jgi:hypothetical protein
MRCRCCSCRRLDALRDTNNGTKNGMARARGDDIAAGAGRGRIIVASGCSARGRRRRRNSEGIPYRVTLGGPPRPVRLFAVTARVDRAAIRAVQSMTLAKGMTVSRHPQAGRGRIRGGRIIISHPRACGRVRASRASPADRKRSAAPAAGW